MASSSKGKRTSRPAAPHRPSPSKKSTKLKPSGHSPSKAKPRVAAHPPPKPATKPSPKPSTKPVKPGGKSVPPADDAAGLPPRGDSRRHILSLSFVRDGDEFLARMESDAGQITELKNRSLDQLLTLVANELEDLLE